MSDSDGSAGKLPLTFGIEIEHLFGINMDIISSDPAYQVLLPQDCMLEANRDNLTGYDPKHKSHTGLLQAVRILREYGARIKVQLSQEGDGSFDMFSKWNMSHDGSVKFPTHPIELRVWSDDKIRDMAGWQFAGLELISPALKVPNLDSLGLQPNGLVELAAYLALLTKNHPPDAPYFFLSGPQVAGVHVHIGLQPQPEGQVEIPVAFLQHLAFICLAFEDTTTLLHHPHRHGYVTSYARNHVGTNRFVGKWPPGDFPRHSCNQGSKFLCEDAFLRIFRASDRTELVELLTTRNGQPWMQTEFFVRECFVNFSNCLENLDRSYKRTIEFRQHHGTLAFEDLSQWVVFVTALGRAAERKAKETPRDDGTQPQSVIQKIEAARARGRASVNVEESGVLGMAPNVPRSHIKDIPPEKLWEDTAFDIDATTTIVQEASKYPDIFQEGKKRSLKELFDLLELPLDVRQYWWQRAKKFRAEWATNWQSQSTCQPDYYCWSEPVRDCEGWADGELDSPPWDVGAAGAGRAPRDPFRPLQAGGFPIHLVDADVDVDMMDTEPPTTGTRAGPSRRRSFP
ncbi:uncharacterized protein A1O5_11500 [Cladophialophora psammophila CBS 110553]|uniref:Amidoligase enzyme n=1 Tax=Cladophialophora psammophila CBS 110553 TaxID=1182543 RepID=W9WFU4_9EURO|nr:uncharacterized protein A1O5_11500 [Cladophialophora psammophila CBS 110553]EXJ63451.1 hypothetical protein A1O5_11500 [Cladophialophora psammophila CBS 110553]